MTNIDMMHHMFGIIPNKKCKECSNLTIHTANRSFKKCRIYGETSSIASDWRLKYTACGMFNREYEGTPVIEIKKHMKRPKDDTPIPGQMELEL